MEIGFDLLEIRKCQYVHSVTIPTLLFVFVLAHFLVIFIEDLRLYNKKLRKHLYRSVSIVNYLLDYRYQF